ncbi:MAG: DUF5906 domain-containing protein [Bacteroidota bacterium]
MAATSHTYYRDRMAQLGITPELNQVTIADDSPAGKHIAQCFSEDRRTGEILIHYFNLLGEVEYYESGKWRKATPYRVKRLRTPKGDKKYQHPSGTATRLYLTPSIIQAYQEATPLNTLFVTEGQFKAFKGHLHQLPIVGISGIWGFRKAQQNRFKDALLELIKTCQVRNLVLLFDADCRDLRPKPDQDLARRLQSFYGAARAFRECAKPYELDAYLAWIHPTLSPEPPKGLDDLYLTFPSKAADITQDLLALTAGQTYAEVHNMTDTSLTRLKSLFFLDRVDRFYEQFKDQIGEEEFQWNHGRYRYDPDQDHVEVIRHPDADKFVRIGCDYYKEIEVINSKGETHQVLKPWTIGVIRQDYLIESRLPRFLEWIEKYDTMANLPDHTANFQRKIITPKGTVAYNLYHPLSHQPRPGTWSTIEGFLKHIFGEELAPSGHPRYLLGLDYLTVLYREPWQKLPIIVLVNREGGTGKSTFMFFLQRIFGQNATLCGNDDLTDSFNSSWVTKLLALIDEGVIEKRMVLEKVKSMATSPTSKLHAKGRDKTQIDLFVKFVFTSNDEDHCIPIRSEETRFWVIKVPVINGKENPDLLEQMTLEIPAFLHHLRERSYTHPRYGRLWFNPAHLKTPALERLINASRPWLEKELHETIREQLLDFQVPEISLTLTRIELLVNKNRRYHTFEIKRILQEKWKLTPKNSTYHSYSWAGSGHTRHIIKTKEKGRFYTFEAREFLEEEEVPSK